VLKDYVPTTQQKKLGTKGNTLLGGGANAADGDKSGSPM
jgi:hypothetical protein